MRAPWSGPTVAPMSKEYDAIVVGARCGGSPTAMLLARAGYSVLLVDRASFPSDTMSTHFVHPPGVAALARWLRPGVWPRRQRDRRGKRPASGICVRSGRRWRPNACKLGAYGHGHSGSCCHFSRHHAGPRGTRCGRHGDDAIWRDHARQWHRDGLSGQYVGDYGIRFDHRE